VPATRKSTGTTFEPELGPFLHFGLKKVTSIRIEKGLQFVLKKVIEKGHPGYLGKLFPRSLLVGEVEGGTCRQKP